MKKYFLLLIFSIMMILFNWNHSTFANDIPLKLVSLNENNIGFLIFKPLHLDIVHQKSQYSRLTDANIKNNVNQTESYHYLISSINKNNLEDIKLTELVLSKQNNCLTSRKKYQNSPRAP